MISESQNVFDNFKPKSFNSKTLNDGHCHITMVV